MWYKVLGVVSLCSVYVSTQVSSLQCKVAGGGDLIPIRTPEYRAWVPLGEVGLNVNDSKVLVFAARSCFGAHILLQNDAADFKNSVYEVVIGGMKNTRSGIRQCVGCKFDEWVKDKSLNCRFFNYFWISWCGDEIWVGRGYKPPQDRFLRHKFENQHVINAASIRSESDTFWALCK
ncbi:uncharacterized protein 5 [Haliotis cracherodii]|uniref:uncharacterized protein 5 n=1 Tax=Haliotis cracherodii TaxID=6455 RepID=UPI0039EB337F